MTHLIFYSPKNYVATMWDELSVLGKESVSIKPSHLLVEVDIERDFALGLYYMQNLGLYDSGVI